MELYWTSTAHRHALALALAHAPELYLYYNCEEVVRQQLNFSQSLLKTSLNILVVVQVKAPKWRG